MLREVLKNRNIKINNDETIEQGVFSSLKTQLFELTIY